MRETSSVHVLTDAFEMTVIDAERDAPVVIELSGELDLHAAKILGDRVDELLDRGVPALHLACVGLSFIDSFGLQALFHTSRKAELHGVGFAVVSMSDRLRALLELTATTNRLRTA
jgi:anti-anti-sigma factor